MNPNLSTVRPEIGYCPQDNIFCKSLTVKENLSVIGMIKGLSISELVEQKEYLIKAFSLGEYSVVADHLSGGNKRKLCAGMAIIGAPSLLFLDELTTGVDPVAKINITRCLKNLPNHSILLTTQRMEEAEGLCE